MGGENRAIFRHTIYDLNIYTSPLCTQVQAIAAAIVPAIRKQYKDLDVQIRFGLVAYRDVCDGAAQWPATLDFTDDVSVMTREVGSGGGEGAQRVAEDVGPLPGTCVSAAKNEIKRSPTSLLPSHIYVWPPTVCSWGRSSQREAATRPRCRLGAAGLV